MHYANPVLHESALNNFDSYYLTWYDSNYSNDGPYGEPLGHTKEGLSNEFFLVYEEAGDGFLRGSRYSENILTDQVYNTMEFPYNGGSSWIDEYESYFANCWGEDIVPRDYGCRGYEDYNGSIEIAGDTNDGGFQDSYSSFSDSVEGAYSVNRWPDHHCEFIYGVKDNYGIPGKLNQPLAKNSEDYWGYMGLWESIFGYWPCLHRLDEHHLPETPLTYSH